jgi:hypothetical protein
MHCKCIFLGEVPLSYGYDSSGKKCVEDNFEDYGQPFNVEDVVGCLIVRIVLFYFRRNFYYT